VRQREELHDLKGQALLASERVWALLEAAEGRSELCVGGGERGGSARGVRGEHRGLAAAGVLAGVVLLEVLAGVGCMLWNSSLLAGRKPFRHFYQHDDSVGTSNWALQIMDKLRRLHRILPWPSSSSSSSTASPSLAVIGFEPQHRPNKLQWHAGWTPQLPPTSICGRVSFCFAVVLLVTLAIKVSCYYCVCVLHNLKKTYLEQFSQNGAN
jgi:hypothetical protein